LSDRDQYGKILVPMVTPFREDQSVDYDAAVKVAEKLVEDHKADSIILTGTTGEFFSMTSEERLRLFETVKDAVGKRIPLIAGTGAPSTGKALELSRRVEELGFNLVMVVAPYYTKPSQREIRNHFERIAHGIGIQLILYNIPLFTGVNIEPDTVARLAEINNVVGIKEEAELNPKQITEYINVTPEDFLIYCGDDAMILEAYVQGGMTRIGGVVSGCSHLIGEGIRKMIDMFLEGRVEETALIQQRYLKLFRVLSPGDRTNPVCLLKDAMRMIGYDAGIPRLPLTPGREEEVAEVRSMLEELELI
jgi:4-hydroxy-tetrahydrodipicolinate synthase